MLLTHALALSANNFLRKKSPDEYVHSVIIELAKLILVGTRTTYQATGTPAVSLYSVIRMQVMYFQSGSSPAWFFDPTVDPIWHPHPAYKAQKKIYIYIYHGLILMQSDSEIEKFTFRSEKYSVFLCSPIVQNPTRQHLIGKTDGPSFSANI